MNDRGVPFGDQDAPAWTSVLGRLRDVVRQSVVAHQLAELTRQDRAPLSVLDVGCGQGTQALELARAGHEVTGLDSSSQLLSRFRESLRDQDPDVRGRVRLVQGDGEQAPRLTPGPFDLVCCHGVLMYLPDPLPLVRAMSQVAAVDGGRVSLLVRNGLAPAMRPGLLGDGRQALEAFDRLDYINRLGLAARAHTPEQLDRLLDPFGCHRDGWFGVRVFADHRDEPAPPGDDPELATLLAAEQRAGRTDPYRQVAALLHVIYRRG